MQGACFSRLLASLSGRSRKRQDALHGQQGAQTDERPPAPTALEEAPLMHASESDQRASGELTESIDWRAPERPQLWP